jgi:hypothetical protein
VVEANNSSVRNVANCWAFTETVANFSTVSGGFASVQPNSRLDINAVEGYALEDFSEEAVKSQISEASKIASGSGSEQDIAEAKIELEVDIPPLVRLLWLLTLCRCWKVYRQP